MDTQFTIETSQLIEKPVKERALRLFIHNDDLGISTARGELLAGAVPFNVAVTASSELTSAPNLRKTFSISNSTFSHASTNTSEKKLTNSTICLFPADPLVFALTKRHSSKSSFNHLTDCNSHNANPRRQFSTHRSFRPATDGMPSLPFQFSAVTLPISWQPLPTIPVTISVPI